MDDQTEASVNLVPKQVEQVERDTQAADRALAALRLSVQELHLALTGLEGRLAPVLSPAASALDAHVVDYHGTSQHLRDLGDSTEKVESARHRVLLLIEALEI